MVCWNGLRWPIGCSLICPDFSHSLPGIMFTSAEKNYLKAAIQEVNINTRGQTIGNRLNIRLLKLGENNHNWDFLNIAIVSTAVRLNWDCCLNPLLPFFLRKRPVISYVCLKSSQQLLKLLRFDIKIQIFLYEVSIINIIYFTWNLFKTTSRSTSYLKSKVKIRQWWSWCPIPL